MIRSATIDVMGHRRFFVLLLLMAVLTVPMVLMAQESGQGSQVSGGLNEEQDATGESGTLPDEERQELASEISENTQDALTLKRLLLGRKYTFFARADVEYASYFDGVLKDEDGFSLRRLRVGMVGILTDTLSYKGELDLTDGTNNFSDFYLKWDSTRFGSFMVGNQRVAQNLSAMTGVGSIIFMERPLPVTTFSLARRLGVSQDFYLKKFGIHGVLFSKDPNNDAGKHGVSLRMITNPVRTDGGLAHVGASVVYEELDEDARYRTRPESHVTDIRLVDTGDYSDVDYQAIAGLELAGALGSFSLRSEGFASRWNRENGKSNRFYGFYIETGHFLTGQHYRYRDGKFISPVLEKGVHAWEVGFRLSRVNLDDDDVRGGVQTNLGAALNWYPCRRVRAQFNLIHYKAERDNGIEKGWIAQARAQLTW